jgi:hypothetical protein
MKKFLVLALTVWLFLLGLCVALRAYAADADYKVFLSGRALHEMQTEGGDLGRMSALGFMQGVVDTLSIQKVLCTPRINGTELYAVVRVYLEAHPERWDYNGADIVYWATMPKWACGRKT